MNLRSPDLVFDEKLHRYTRGGRTLVSVTQLLDRVIKPFDAVSASERVALRRSRELGRKVDPAEVRAEWEAKKNKFGSSGNRLHKIAEAVVQGRYTPCGDGQADELHALWTRLVAKGLQYVACELKMDHPTYNLAGTCDLLARGNLGLWVGDWKQTAKFDTEGGWPNFLPPFDDLLTNKLTLFSIQVSMYRVMIEDRLGEKTAGGFIGYVPANGKGQFHLCHDYRERVRAWLPTVEW